ncbi:substrate-binding periplasmic protein [Vibrio sp. SCSIO 43137]|uniref:substrate-binding periplasmic protein n=1 Tax=Vibrio sp. SCSIO 43137 TaxID=3021011 RepID=UPI0023072BEC|nr:transporter substrate-binding domain-containing protein [Vibrio sp. SCSIO 43137]WCE28828.1 transporter substrate-binding domain-containing protein [Vibrio sp. SCSIO 43137]
MKNILILILFSFISKAAIAETYLFVGTTFPSILEQKKNGEVYGLGHDIAKRIAARLGHEIIIEVYPFQRAMKMVAEGKADAFIGPYKTAEREKFMHYSKYAFYQDPMVFYVKANETLAWNRDFTSLEGLRVGLTRGWSYGEEFDRYKAELDIHTASTVKANFQKLLVGRIDVLVSHPRSTSVLIEELDIENQVKMVLPPITINKGYYGFSRKKKLGKFILQFDREFQKMIKNGDILKLNRNYGLDFVSDVNE